MSRTFATSALNIRSMMNDNDAAAYAINTDRLYHVLAAQAGDLGGGPLVGEDWVTAIITLSGTGSPDFAFPATSQIERIIHLRRASDGLLLARVSSDEIERLRQSASPGTGPPTHYYLFEPPSGILKARFWPRPVAADTIDALRATGASTTTYTDATSIDYSEGMCDAIEAATAAELFVCLDDATRSRLGLGAGAAGAWMSRVASGVRAERERKGRLHDVSRIPAQVN